MDSLIIEADDRVVELDGVQFTPSGRRNLLGHVAEWTAELTAAQAAELATLTDDYGEGLRVEWGVFMCPARLIQRVLTVNTEGVW